MVAGVFRVSSCGTANGLRSRGKTNTMAFQAIYCHRLDAALVTQLQRYVIPRTDVIPETPEVADGGPPSLRRRTNACTDADG